MMIKKYGFNWKEITVPEIKNHLGKKDLMCLTEDDCFFIETTDVAPDYIRFDMLLHGKWYIKIACKKEDVESEGFENE